MKPFVYLKDQKLKTRVVEKGVEQWLECCHFLDSGALIIFKVIILEVAHTRTYTLTIDERVRNQDWKRNLTTTSRARLPLILQLAERAIADRIADLNKKYEIEVEKAHGNKGSVDQTAPASRDSGT